MDTPEELRNTLSLESNLSRIGITSLTFPQIFEKSRIFGLKANRAFIPEQRGRVADALLLMLEVHFDQNPRPDGTPYTDHPLTVADKIMDIMVNPDPELVIAALLHDSVEDQSNKLARKYRGYNADSTLTDEQAALEFIKVHYGARVGRTVAALSNPDFNAQLAILGINENHPDYRIHKNILYAQHVAEISENPDAFLIKLMDFTSNAGDLMKLPDGSQKIKLMRKYGPVVGTMKDGLSRLNLPIKEKAKILLEAKLEDIDNYISQQISAK
ncbi:HD domain-containing protein [Candidatus Daviesbacteria bacterium]|nr:HD domain-containing protein [Candidatus Daviesbacteria bacterium]